MNDSERPGSPDVDPELIDERPDERLDTVRLEPYLRANLPHTDGPLHVSQFGGGHANLTYLVRFGDTEYVLRRPPLGPIAPRSHDMGREYRVLSNLSRVFDLAPNSFVHCQDESIIGVEFQIMERRQGIVIRKQVPAHIHEVPGLVRRIGEMMIDTLAAFHRVDRVAAGLEALGRPEGFVPRQLAGWSSRWRAACPDGSARMDALVAWLEHEVPESTVVSLVHNDFKLDNIIVAANDPGHAVAMLDWDMCTVGDPLCDLGYLMNLWMEPQDGPDLIAAGTMPTAEPGFPSRAEAVERYGAASGIDISRFDWHHAFAAMRLAVIIQQIYIRWVRGQTQDERFRHYGRRADLFIEKGCRIAGI